MFTSLLNEGSQSIFSRRRTGCHISSTATFLEVVHGLALEQSLDENERARTPAHAPECSLEHENSRCHREDVVVRTVRVSCCY